MFKLFFSVQAKVCCYLPVLIAKRVWKIIGHLGGFNGAALMESFSCSALHFITSVCQLYLIYKVSQGQRMWSINLWVGDYTRERERRWQDISFTNMAGCPSIIPCRIGVSHFSHYSYQERPFPGILWESARVCMSLCDLYKKVHNRSIRFQSYCAFVQVGLIAHHTGLSEVCWHRWFVFTQGSIWML